MLYSAVQFTITQIIRININDIGFIFFLGIGKRWKKKKHNRRKFIRIKRIFKIGSLPITDEVFFLLKKLKLLYPLLLNKP
jgi:hypothetical protein